MQRRTKFLGSLRRGDALREEELLKGRKWHFLGVTSSGHFVYRDEAREYLYIPADKKNKLVRIK